MAQMIIIPLIEILIILRYENQVEHTSFAGTSLLSYVSGQTAFSRLPRQSYPQPNPSYSWRNAAIRPLIGVQWYNKFYIGYNLMLNGSKNEHIEVANKYEVIETSYPTSYNFSNVKIRPNNRFLGLITKGDYSGLVVGTNDDTKGVTVNFEIGV